MTGRQCYHCKAWLEPGEAHDCWTTTPEALTHDLPEDLREAWERLRDSALEFGEQRVYASHHSIMFSRKACYFFVRPKRSALEICVFLGRRITAPQITRATPSSRRKVAHFLHVRHRDEVEAPLTDWLREAYDLSDALSARTRAGASGGRDATRSGASASSGTTSVRKRAKTSPAGTAGAKGTGPGATRKRPTRVPRRRARPRR